MNRDGLLTLCEYNRYANQLVWEVVNRLTADELTRPVSPSHESVQSLLTHMLMVEAVFLARCQGGPLDRPELPTLADVLGYWSNVAQAAQRFIAEQTDDDLQCEMAAFDTRPLRLPRWQLLLQAFMHSAHHRGELSIVLTELGHPLPTLDIIIHFAEQSGQGWPFP